MRNFKKFLALVLAMLMVSACAVSVSAAFTDQAAVDASDYKAAIELLADLGVVKGDENGVFNPEGTLLREQAAVFAAKLLAGANAPEWADQTTTFVDVVDVWSFPYINYVKKANVMIGDENGLFNPKENLKIDQAIKIALSVADPEAARQAKIDTSMYPTGYWADWYIHYATEALLLEDVDVDVLRNTEAECSRGLFAQIMANAFYNGRGIMKNFGYVSMKATVDVVTENNKKYVVITDTAPVDEDEDEEPFSIKVTDEFFTAALVAEGYTDITAADLAAGVKTKPCYINIACLEKTKEIKSIEVLTEIDVVKYDDGLIKVVKDANGNLVKTEIEIDDVKYTVNDIDRTSAGAWGEGSSTVRGIMLYVDGSIVPEMATTTIPDFYEAFLYDDNGDGDYERAAIKTYYAGILVDAGKDESDKDADNNKTEQLTTIKQYGKDVALAIDPACNAAVNITFSGETATYGKTPVLYRVDGTNVDILEVAKTDVKGEVANFKEDNYINLGETKVEFAKAYINPEKWVLDQNVAVYTIGGKYVDVVNEGVTTGVETQKILVDNVTVKDGVALIDGFKWNSNGTLTAVEDFEVVGVVENSKLLPKAYTALKKTYTNDDNVYAGLVGNGTANDAGTGWKTAGSTFGEGQTYTFKVTNAGAYLVGEDAALALSALKPKTATEFKVEIKNGYFYNYTNNENDAAYKMAAAYTVLTNVEDDDAKDAYAAVSYKILDTYKYDKSSAKVWGVDDNGDLVAVNSTNRGTYKVAFVYAVTATNNEVAGEQTKLNDGETLVKIIAVENEALSASTYLAQDLFTGAKVEVTGNANNIGDYVLVDKDGKIIDAAPLWIYDEEFGKKSVTVTVKFDGKTITGHNTMIVDPVGDADKYLDEKVLDTGAVTFTDIKYWVLNGDTTDNEYDIKAGDLSTIFTTAGAHEFVGCIINGVVIVLG